MNIHQISVEYDERQDRLSVRVSNQVKEEFRFWLTRSMTLRLLPHLQAAVVHLESRDPQVMATDTTAQQMLAELKRENFLSCADFSTPFASQNLSLPFGETPLLITDVQLKVLSGGSLTLLLQDKTGDNAIDTSLELSLQPTLLHGLLHLIEAALKKATWQQPDFSHRSDLSESHVSEGPAYRH
jgi:hypothetical protein